MTVRAGVRVVPAGVAIIGRLMVVTTFVVLVAGTVVTATGPHGGDENAERLSRFDITEVVRVHAVAAWTLLALTAVALAWLRSQPVRREMSIGEAPFSSARSSCRAPSATRSTSPVCLHCWSACTLPAASSCGSRCFGSTSGCSPIRSRTAGVGQVAKWAPTRHNRRMSTAPVEVEEPDIDDEVDVDPDRPWIVIVWNDPINLMDYVTYVFQKLFGYSREKAEQLMLDVHHKGRAVVSNGSREKAELDVFRLHEHGLWATMQQD